VVLTAEPPASLTAGSGFGLQASIEDTHGNVVTSATNTVSLSLASNPTGATLGGTLSLSASDGVAAFAGLTLTQAASGYTLRASSNRLGSAATSPVTVTPASPAQVAIVRDAQEKRHEPAPVPVSGRDRPGRDGRDPQRP
jgi:hypothetical protein